MSARTSVRHLAQRGVRLAARAKDRVGPPAPGVAVLLYHRVGGHTPVSVDLPRGQFAHQMATVAERAATLDDALDVLASPSAADGSRPLPVVVTFDDGTADIIDEVLPILVEHRVPALLYLATRVVEESVPFPDDGKPASWSALADGLGTGYLQIGSHTHSHALLDRLPAAEVDAELDRSIGLIQDRLGVDPVHFAYPKALPGSAAADAAVRRRFRSAALAGTRLNPPGATDPWALARTPIQARDHAESFGAKVSGGLGLEDDLRRVVNRVRHRGATT